MPELSSVRACKRCKRRSSEDASKGCHTCLGAVHPRCSGRVATRDCGLPLGFPEERAFCSKLCYEAHASHTHPLTSIAPTPVGNVEPVTAQPRGAPVSMATSKTPIATSNTTPLTQSRRPKVTSQAISKVTEPATAPIRSRASGKRATRAAAAAPSPSTPSATPSTEASPSSTLPIYSRADTNAVASLTGGLVTHSLLSVDRPASPQATSSSTGWSVSDAAPVVFPTRIAPSVTMSAADAVSVVFPAREAALEAHTVVPTALSSPLIPAPPKRDQSLPDEVTFSLAIKIGEAGRTTRKFLSLSTFGFQVSDGFEAFLTKANTRTATEFEQIAETSCEPFIRNDHSVYIRPGAHSKQSDLVELTEQNFVPRITRTYHNFLKRKSAADAERQFQCHVVTYVNKDNRHSIRSERTHLAVSASPHVKAPSSAASSANRAHSFIEYATQPVQHKSEQRPFYHPQCSPAVVATDTLVVVAHPGPPLASTVGLAAAPSPVASGSPRTSRPQNPYRQQKRKRSQPAEQQSLLPPRIDPTCSDPGDDGAYTTIRMVLNGQVVPVKVNVRDLLACAGLVTQAAGVARGTGEEDDSDNQDHDGGGRVQR